MLDNPNLTNDLFAKGLKGLVASSALSISGHEKNDIFSMANVKRGAVCGIAIYLWEEVVLSAIKDSNTSSGLKGMAIGDTPSFP